MDNQSGQSSESPQDSAEEFTQSGASQVTEFGGIRGYFRRAGRIINIASESFGVVAVIVLVCMMMLTVTDVVLRYFFNSPIMASMEITEYMMVIVGFLGLAWCAIKGMHIKVELIVGKWPEKGQAIINIINTLLILGLCGLIASQSLVEGFVAREMGRASDITDIPHFPFYWIVVLGYILLFFAMLTIIVQNIRKVMKP